MNNEQPSIETNPRIAVDMQGNGELTNPGTPLGASKPDLSAYEALGDRELDEIINRLESDSTFMEAQAEVRRKVGDVKGSLIGKALTWRGETVICQDITEGVLAHLINPNTNKTEQVPIEFLRDKNIPEPVPAKDVQIGALQEN